MKITKVEIKQTKTGKDYKSLTFEDGKSVNMWSNDPDYEIAIVDATLERTLEQDGQYLKLNQKRKANNYKTQQIEQAQVRKEQSINRTLDRKEESIVLTSSARDATLMITTIINHNKNINEDYLKQKWEEWRQYFINQYTKDITDLTQPF